jgi:hypothetical protein
MRQALHGRERFRDLAGALNDDLRIRAKKNAVMAAELLHPGWKAPDYGSDARALIGRMVMAQVATAESLVERVRACWEVFDHPVPEMRPLDLADGLIRKVKDLRIERDGTRKQLGTVQEEATRFRQELQDAVTTQNRLSAENLEIAQELGNAVSAQKRLSVENLEIAVSAQKRLERTAYDLELALARGRQADSQVAALTNAAKALEERLAPLESKTSGGIAKRALQVVLDLLQILTPAPLRAAVRKQYMNWFYFRIYPERRGSAAQAADTSLSRDPNPDSESDPKPSAGSIRP